MLEHEQRRNIPGYEGAYQVGARGRVRNYALWPDTTMARAYLIALTKWALTHHENLKARVTLPIGVVGAEELLNVLRALEKARPATEHRA
jgi:NUMOD4 motif-containing protein